MGQYHLVVNLDKRQFIHPHQLGDGLKLLEFGCSGEGGVMTALAVLLACSSRQGGRGGGDFTTDREQIVGSWAGDRIAIIGDYAEPDDLPAEFNAQAIYSMCAERPDDYDAAIAWFEDRAANCVDDRDEADKASESARFMRDNKPYTNITPIIRALLDEGLPWVHYGTGDGWIDRKSD